MLLAQDCSASLGTWDGWGGALIGAFAAGVFGVAAALIAGWYGAKKARESFREQDARHAVGDICAQVTHTIQVMNDPDLQAIRSGLTQLKTSYISVLGIVPPSVQKLLGTIDLWLDDYGSPWLNGLIRQERALPNRHGDVAEEGQDVFDRYRAEGIAVISQMLNAMRGQLILWHQGVEPQSPEPSMLPDSPELSGLVNAKTRNGGMEAREPPRAP